MLTVHLIPFMFGLYFILKKDKTFKEFSFAISCICFNIFVYSLLAHKEFRFLTQIMPFMMLICAYGLQRMETFTSIKYVIIRTFLNLNLHLSILNQLFNKNLEIFRLFHWYI
jgi:hypothetical protein